MRNQKFYLYSIGSVLSSSAALILAFTGIFLPAAVLGFGTLGFRHLASKEGNKSGRTDRMKLTASLSDNISELLVLAAVLVSGLVTTTVLLGILLVLSLEKAFLGDLKNRVLRSMSLRFGAELRITLASSILAASYFNPHSAFWGSILLLFTTVYDTAYLIYSGLSEA